MDVQCACRMKPGARKSVLLPDRVTAGVPIRLQAIETVLAWDVRRERMGTLPEKIKGNGELVAGTTMVTEILMNAAVRISSTIHKAGSGRRQPTRRARPSVDRGNADSVHVTGCRFRGSGLNSQWLLRQRLRLPLPVLTR